MQNILWGSAKILSKPRPDGTSTMFMCISIDICTYKSTCFMVPAKGYCNNPIAFYELLIQFKTGDRQVSSQRDLQQCCTFVIYHPCLVGLIFFFFLPVLSQKKVFSQASKSHQNPEPWRNPSIKEPHHGDRREEIAPVSLHSGSVVSATSPAGEHRTLPSGC